MTLGLANDDPRQKFTARSPRKRDDALGKTPGSFRFEFLSSRVHSSLSALSSRRAIRERSYFRIRLEREREREKINKFRDWRDSRESSFFFFPPISTTLPCRYFAKDARSVCSSFPGRVRLFSQLKQTLSIDRPTVYDPPR